MTPTLYLTDRGSSFWRLSPGKEETGVVAGSAGGGAKVAGCRKKMAEEIKERRRPDSFVPRMERNGAR